MSRELKNTDFSDKSKEGYLLKYNEESPHLKTSKIKLKCDYCGKDIYKSPSQIKKHNFCCMDCVNSFASKTKNPDHYNELKDFTNIAATFKKVNKITNKTRMTPEVIEKVRQGHIKNRINNKSTTYYKFHGRHEHRVIAEEILGRPLKPGEIVHHIDGNKHNNSKENLMIFSSQSEHAKWHAQNDLNWGMKKEER